MCVLFSKASSTDSFGTYAETSLVRRASLRNRYRRRVRSQASVVPSSGRRRRHTRGFGRQHPSACTPRPRPRCACTFQELLRRLGIRQARKGNQLRPFLRSGRCTCSGMMEYCTATPISTKTLSRVLVSQLMFSCWILVLILLLKVSHGQKMHAKPSHVAYALEIECGARGAP
eukprot:scaffold309_cov235-Pinguiococcus_pyrenoidosus.AAC.23